jgi:DNA-binding CsgD family transcriptional regulator
MRRLRGRPRHDDVLTPREWEVLSLLREGLTNEQIAERLGVSFDTAKFHVSEIIGKLGVESRQEAAAWRGAPRGVPVPAAAPSAWQRMGLTSPVRVFAASMIATVAVGLLALAGGLILMSSRDGDDPAAPGVESRTGDEALDAMIESLLTGDAASLASRFAGVTARESEVLSVCLTYAMSPTPSGHRDWRALRNRCTQLSRTRGSPSRGGTNQLHRCLALRSSRLRATSTLCSSSTRIARTATRTPGV